MVRSPQVVMIAICLILVVGSAAAEQTLIPTPYPETVPGAAPLDPDPVETGRPQTLLHDPYPQLLGNNAQGNPPITRHHRNQHLVPSISQRKYRVDRP